MFTDFSSFALTTQVWLILHILKVQWIFFTNLIFSHLLTIGGNFYAPSTKLFAREFFSRFFKPPSWLLLPYGVWKIGISLLLNFLSTDVLYISTLTKTCDICKEISIENYLTPTVPTMDCKDATEQEDPAVDKMTKKITKCKHETHSLHSY